MQHDSERVIAVLTKALAVCRGLLYSARTGDATKGEIECILESTGQESLISLIGQAFSYAVGLSEALSKEDVDILLAIGDKPYDDR